MRGGQGWVGLLEGRDFQSGVDSESALLSWPTHAEHFQISTDPSLLLPTSLTRRSSLSPFQKAPNASASHIYRCLIELLVSNRHVKV